MCGGGYALALTIKGIAQRKSECARKGITSSAHPAA
jgi:hypothetical protein